MEPGPAITWATGPAITFRTGRRADLPAVSGLLSSLFRTVYGPLVGPDRAAALDQSWHSVERLTQQLDLAGSSFLIAEDGGRIVAHAFASAQDNAVLLVLRLYVGESHQRLGIGTRLLSELGSRHPAAETARLYVADGNAAAAAFYERRGFRAVGRAEEDGLTSTQMERSIRS